MSDLLTVYQGMSAMLAENQGEAISRNSAQERTSANDEKEENTTIAHQTSLQSKMEAIRMDMDPPKQSQTPGDRSTSTKKRAYQAEDIEDEQPPAKKPRLETSHLGRSSSPSPPSPIMTGHPAYDGDSFRPLIRLPGQSIPSNYTINDLDQFSSSSDGDEPHSAKPVVPVSANVLGASDLFDQPLFTKKRGHEQEDVGDEQPPTKKRRHEITNSDQYSSSSDGDEPHSAKPVVPKSASVVEANPFDEPLFTKKRGHEQEDAGYQQPPAKDDVREKKRPNQSSIPSKRHKPKWWDVLGVPMPYHQFTEHPFKDHEPDWREVLRVSIQPKPSTKGARAKEGQEAQIKLHDPNWWDVLGVPKPPFPFTDHPFKDHEPDWREVLQVSAQPKEEDAGDQQPPAKKRLQEKKHPNQSYIISKRLHPNWYDVLEVPKPSGCAPSPFENHEPHWREVLRVAAQPNSSTNEEKAKKTQGAQIPVDAPENLPNKDLSHEDLLDFLVSLPEHIPWAAQQLEEKNAQDVQDIKPGLSDRERNWLVARMNKEGKADLQAELQEKMEAKCQAEVSELVVELRAEHEDRWAELEKRQVAAKEKLEAGFGKMGVSKISILSPGYRRKKNSYWE